MRRMTAAAALLVVLGAAHAQEGADPPATPSRDAVFRLAMEPDAARPQQPRESYTVAIQLVRGEERVTAPTITMFARQRANVTVMRDLGGPREGLQFEYA